MSEPMFNSVVVEREGHALTVVVHYEKHPFYYANCKTLGHDIHNCFKLISNNRNDTAIQVPKKPTAQTVTKENNNHNGTKEIHNTDSNGGMTTQIAGPSHLYTIPVTVVSPA